MISRLAPGTLRGSSAQKTSLFISARAGDAVGKCLVHAAAWPFSAPQRTRNIPSSSKPDKASAKSQKVGGANHKLPQELHRDLPTELSSDEDVEELMQFVSLSASRCVKLGVGDGDRAKPSHGRAATLSPRG